MPPPRIRRGQAGSRCCPAGPDSSSTLLKPRESVSASPLPLSSITVRSLAPPRGCVFACVCVQTSDTQTPRAAIAARPCARTLIIFAAVALCSLDNHTITIFSSRVPRRRAFPPPRTRSEPRAPAVTLSDNPGPRRAAEARAAVAPLVLDVAVPHTAEHHCPRGPRPVCCSCLAPPLLCWQEQRQHGWRTANGEYVLWFLKRLSLRRAVRRLVAAAVRSRPEAQELKFRAGEVGL